MWYHLQAFWRPWLNISIAPRGQFMFVRGFTKLKMVSKAFRREMIRRTCQKRQERLVGGADKEEARSARAMDSVNLLRINQFSFQLGMMKQSAIKSKFVQRISKVLFSIPQFRPQLSLWLKIKRVFRKGVDFATSSVMRSLLLAAACLQRPFQTFLLLFLHELRASSLDI